MRSRCQLEMHTMRGEYVCPGEEMTAYEDYMVGDNDQADADGGTAGIMSSILPISIFV